MIIKKSNIYWSLYFSAKIVRKGHQGQKKRVTISLLLKDELNETNQIEIT